METATLPAPQRSVVGYRREYADMAEVAAAEMGATDAQLAKLFKVSRKSISKWKTQHPSFAEALRRGKAEADNRAERSLFQRATGYTYTERKIVNDDEVTVYERHAPPDVGACLKWLYNRKPHEWRPLPVDSVDGGEPLRPVAINIIARDASLRDEGESEATP